MVGNEPAATERDQPAQGAIDFEAAITAVPSEGNMGLLGALVAPYLPQLEDLESQGNAVRIWCKDEYNARRWLYREPNEREAFYNELGDSRDRVLRELNERRVALITELAGGLQLVAEAAFPDNPVLQNALMWKALTGESLPPTLGEEGSVGAEPVGAIEGAE